MGLLLDVSSGEVLVVVKLRTTTEIWLDLLLLHDLLLLRLSRVLQMILMMLEVGIAAHVNELGCHHNLSVSRLWIVLWPLIVRIIWGEHSLHRQHTTPHRRLIRSYLIIIIRNLIHQR